MSTNLNKKRIERILSTFEKSGEDVEYLLEKALRNCEQRALISFLMDGQEAVKENLIWKERAKYMRRVIKYWDEKKNNQRYNCVPTSFDNVPIV